MTTATSSQIVRGTLASASATLDGLEDLRIASASRLRHLTRSEADSDGEVRGLGLLPLNKSVVTAMEILKGIQTLEHQAILDLQRQVRQHETYALIKRQKGLGEKQMGRLLATIGDPYWNDLHGRPRTVSELWAYCGYSVVAGASQRRKKGELSNWSSAAKMRAFLVAESCVKTKGHYRDVYDEARDKYADAVHGVECVRCGPKGKPAQPGSPLSAGHQHARALRAIAKEVLRDLWIEAKRAHEASAQTTEFAEPKVVSSE